MLSVMMKWIFANRLPKYLLLEVLQRLRGEQRAEKEAPVQKRCHRIELAVAFRTNAAFDMPTSVRFRLF